MSAENSSANPDPAKPDLPITPLGSPIDKAAQEIKAGDKPRNSTKADPGDPPKPPSYFQRFMHKHFPEAKAHDRWTLVFTAIIAGSTALYTFFAGWTLLEIQHSFVLTRQGVKGTQAAIVSFQCSVDFDSDRLTLRTENHGHVIAENVTGRYVVTRKEWPTKRLIGNPVPIEFPPEPLRSVENGGGQSVSTLPIPGMTKPDWDAIGRGEQFFTIEQGSTSYGNGFGDIIVQEIPCRSMLYLAPLKLKNGGSTNIDPQWVPCEQFDSRMTDALGSRRKTVEANQ